MVSQEQLDLEQLQYSVAGMESIISNEFSRLAVDTQSVRPSVRTRRLGPFR